MEENNNNITEVTEQPQTVTEQQQVVTEQPQTVTEQQQIVTEQPQTLEQQVFTQEVSTKKKKDIKLIAIIIAAVLILISGIYLGYKKFFSPKAIFIKSVNKEYKKIEKLIDSSFGFESDKPVLVTNNLKINFDVDDSLTSDSSIKNTISEFNKLGLNSQIGIDSKNMEALVKLNALYDNKSLLNINGYLINNSVFVELKDLYDKYIEMPVETTNSISQNNSLNLKDLDKEDIKYLMSKTKDAILNNLNEKDFKKSSSKVKVDGKEVRVKKISYKLSEKSLYEMANGALDSLSSDSKYIKILAKMTGAKEEEIKTGLAAASTMMGLADSKDLDKTTIGTISIYIKGVEGISFEIENEKYGNSGISYYYNKNNKVINMTNNGGTLLDANINDKKASIIINDLGEEKLKLNVTKEEKDKNKIYNYILETADTKLKGKLVIETIKKNDDGTGEYKISSQASTMGIDFKLASNLKIEYKDKLNIPNISNSVKYEELSEADYQKISYNLLKNNAFITLIEKFIPAEVNMY